MTVPFSLRMDDDVHADLAAHSDRLDVNASRLVNRYVKEGVRMDKHAAITFKTTSLGRRAVVLAAHPGVQVIDVVGTWAAEGRDVSKTARYLHLDREEVEAALRYYADYPDEIDRDLKEHLDAQSNYKQVLAHREVHARRRVAKV